MLADGSWGRVHVPRLRCGRCQPRWSRPQGAPAVGSSSKRAWRSWNSASRKLTARWRNGLLGFRRLSRRRTIPPARCRHTFYVSHPARYALRRPDMVERIQRTHETAGNRQARAGATSGARARAQVCCHAHDASSSRGLPATRAQRRRFSASAACSGAKRWTISTCRSSMQVDGIIIDEHHLRGPAGHAGQVLRAHGHRRSGVQTGLFPYTEPSVGVQVKLGGKCSSWPARGCFRPEVTPPVWLARCPCWRGRRAWNAAWRSTMSLGIKELYRATWTG